MTTYSELTDYVTNSIVSLCYNVNTEQDYSKFPQEMKAGFYKETTFDGGTEHPKTIIVSLNKNPVAIYSPNSVKLALISYLKKFHDKNVFNPENEIKPNGIFSFFDTLNLFCFNNIKFLVSPIAPSKTITVFTPFDNQKWNSSLDNEIIKMIQGKIWIFDVIDYLMKDTVKWHKGIREQIVEYSYSTIVK